ncbi:crossover junction endonuclease MUS81 [Thalassophryne amazonica]|uniref:crossover junction endonuclease MUS81 n=1 Tax=Thalassophryne amazonica TaxID=390379 RepID=UPI0014719ECD|nr:crossover junction endonuclease MUS81 [Thalassophryne amazonica]
MSASEQVRFGRKRVLPSCPNPLFLQWLTELRDEARDRGLKTQFTYQKAINSLNKYPLPLQNAKEAKILQNFGDGICKILDDKLQRYYRENGPNAKIHSLPEGAPPAVQADNHSLVPSKKKNGVCVGGESGEGKTRRRKKDYVPQKRSGCYAVLLSLYRESQLADGKGYMLKYELQTEAQHLCDKSLTVPEPGSKYTAWSSVSTLIQKNLVLKTHNPARYSLTEEGLALAERLDSAERLTDNRPDGDGEDSPGVVDLTCSDEEEQEENQRTHPTERPECVTQMRTEPDGRNLPNSQYSNLKPNGGRLPPGSYYIVLCVDVIETTGASHHRKQELVKELQRNGVNFDVRKLNVGDFLWVAREKVAPVPGQLRAPAGRELVLDYIIERKRMDDLCGSIIDGRFREQKFRLKRCGLRQPIYLIESGVAAAHLSIPEATLQQAIVNTQVVDGFFVKRVQDVRESAAYLTVMTRHLTKLYQNCTLTCCSRGLDGDAPREEQQTGRPFCSLMSFAEFNQGAVKNKCQTVREVFARQLMQVSGLSGDKAAAILNHYSTPYRLITAYECCTREEEKEKLLSSIRYGKLRRNLGPALSRTIYQLYCSPGALS